MTRDDMVALLSEEHPEHPVLNGCVSPHVTVWRCSSCLLGRRVANATQREWCVVRPERLQLLTPVGNPTVAVGPAT